MNTEKQKGAALFISLMLLFLMTIIGLNALDTATSDERMALNSQHEQEVFHAAESAINLIKRNDASILATVTAGVGGSFGPIAFNGQPNVVTSASATYVGCDDPPPGYEFEFAYHNVDVTSTAQLANSGAQTAHSQRMAKVAPDDGCPLL